MTNYNTAKYGVDMNFESGLLLFAPAISRATRACIAASLVVSCWRGRAISIDVDAAAFSLSSTLCRDRKLSGSGDRDMNF